GIAPRGRFALPVVEPTLLREKTFSALSSVIRAISLDTHALLLVEDLQWADQTTLELLSRLAVMQPPTPLLILGTARTEFTASWTGPDDVIELGRLPSVDEMELIEELGRLYGVPKDFWDAIASRSDGNPLFAEELAKTMGGAEHLPSNTDAIPRTIRGLLTARLDGLGDDKWLAQCASVVGREIDVDLLRVVSGRS